MSFKKICICLILIFCIIGAASAAEDVSTDVVDASADTVVVDAVSDDASDSLESVVVEDEPVVDESAPAQDDEIDDEEQTNNVLSSDGLPDQDYYIVNEDDVNIANFQETVQNAHDQAPEEQDILIYLPYATFDDTFEINTNLWNNHNYFFVSREKDKTIFDGRLEHIMGMTPGWDDDNTMTFINITFKSLPRVELSNHKVFINCTFIDCGIIANNETYYMYLGAPENVMGVTQSLVTNFTDCLFINTTITSLMFSQTNFENCIFKDLTADSLVNTNTDGGREDGVHITNCTFENVVVNGILDYTTNNEVLYSIEDCDYDFAATVGAVPNEDNSHYYLNATKLAKPATTLIADVDDAGNLLVNLTAGDNAVANGKVLISVNGAEAVSYDLGEDGTLSIALSDLTDATGKLNIAVSFEETDDYKGSTGSASAVLVVKTVTEKIDPVATSITASDITATAKIAKTLSITLKDASGNALANKAVKVTVNGKTSTVTTDSNGVAKVTVNYAKAGTYYYTFTYLGDNDYKASIKPVKVTVNKQATKATFAKKTFKVKATKKISFTLKDSKGKAIAKKKITFKVNGKTYTAKTNSKGVATVKIVIKKKGKYTATAKFAGDTTYKAVSKKAAITIR